MSALFIAHFTQVHSHHPLGPEDYRPASTWFEWADQQAYYVAARAWATGDLSADNHLYPAGYSLLAAPFFRLLPAEPFYVPNMVCWIASLWLFSSLATQLGRGLVAHRAVGGLLFFLVTVMDTRSFYTWEIPWTSTPVATLAFAALLAGLRCVSHASVRCAFTAAMLAGLTILFRPTDAMLFMPSVAGMILLSAVKQRRSQTIVPAAMAGFCIGPALLLWTHWLTHGWALDHYFANSRQIGFEWRLLPLRWVTLVIDPQPLFPWYDGLETFFPYLLPGIAGVLACVIPRRDRAKHLLSGGVAIVFLCLHLCYRDLHVDGVNLFFNDHYFKWILPIFALYAVNLLHMLVLERRRVVAVFAIGAVMLLSAWRAELGSDARAPPSRIVDGGRGLAVPGGLAYLNQAVLVPSSADYVSTYFGGHELTAPGHTYRANADFKLYPVPGGFMLAPLRPLPGPLLLTPAPPLQLDPARVPVAVRQRLDFGIPCIVFPWRASCRYSSPLESSK